MHAVMWPTFINNMASDKHEKWGLFCCLHQGVVEASQQNMQVSFCCLFLWGKSTSLRNSNVSISPRHQHPMRRKIPQWDFTKLTKKRHLDTSNQVRSLYRIALLLHYRHFDVWCRKCQRHGVTVEILVSSRTYCCDACYRCTAALWCSAHAHVRALHLPFHDNIKFVTWYSIPFWEYLCRPNHDLAVRTRLLNVMVSESMLFSVDELWVAETNTAPPTWERGRGDIFVACSVCFLHLSAGIFRGLLAFSFRRSRGLAQGCMVLLSGHLHSNIPVTPGNISWGMPTLNTSAVCSTLCRGLSATAPDLQSFGMVGLSIYQSDMFKGESNNMQKHGGGSCMHRWGQVGVWSEIHGEWRPPWGHWAAMQTSGKPDSKRDSQCWA